jgi:photosystem II stability/assembly factor-like uncharacterized protein
VVRGHIRRFAAFLAVVSSAPCQWIIQESHSTASLRGIHNAGSGIAWASGTQGTVLRTTDDGKTWQRCAVPPNAAELDFRGVQAFDANIAFVMSSGKGDLSRIYKTTDGCRSWMLMFTNPDVEGFFDAIRVSPSGGVVVGDPVDGRFAIFVLDKSGDRWRRSPENRIPAALAGEGLFAASNSSIVADGPHLRASVTGGRSGAALISGRARTKLPLVASDSGGGFSIAVRGSRDSMIVGGDYRQPDESRGTAVFVHGGTVTVPSIPPHGYRSAVAWDAPSKTWIAVGPNGTDVSSDDGKTWLALHPGKDDAPDADKNWNALSLPYAVGPNGRIGSLRARRNGF